VYRPSANLLLSIVANDSAAIVFLGPEVVVTIAAVGATASIIGATASISGLRWRPTIRYPSLITREPIVEDAVNAESLAEIVIPVALMDDVIPTGGYLISMLRHKPRHTPDCPDILVVRLIAVVAVLMHRDHKSGNRGLGSNGCPARLSAGNNLGCFL